MYQWISDHILQNYFCVFMYHIPDFQKVQGHVHELQNSEIFRNNSS